MSLSPVSEINKETNPVHYLGLATLDGRHAMKPSRAGDALVTSYYRPGFISHDDVRAWKRCPHYWPFVRGIHRWIPLAQRTSNAKSQCLFVVSFNKMFNKQPSSGWFEMTHMWLRWYLHWMTSGMAWKTLRYVCSSTRNGHLGLSVATLIARLMGPTWGPSGADRPRWAPCWPHELCYLGKYPLYLWHIKIFTGNLNTVARHQWH